MIQVDSASTAFSYADVAHSSVPSTGDTDATAACRVLQGGGLLQYQLQVLFRWQKSLLPYEYLKGSLSTFLRTSSPSVQLTHTTPPVAIHNHSTLHLKWNLDSLIPHPPLLTDFMPWPLLVLKSSLHFYPAPLSTGASGQASISQLLMFDLGSLVASE